MPIVSFRILDPKEVEAKKLRLSVDAHPHASWLLHFLKTNDPSKDTNPTLFDPSYIVMLAPPSEEDKIALSIAAMLPWNAESKYAEELGSATSMLPQGDLEFLYELEQFIRLQGENHAYARGLKELEQTIDQRIRILNSLEG